MGTTKRFWALCMVSATAATVGMAACSDGDQTLVCVGPECPNYDGVGGNRGVLHDGNPAGSAGTEGGIAGASSEGGSAGSPADLPDGGTDPEPSDSGVSEPDATSPPPPCELAFVTPVTGGASELTLDGSSDLLGDACGAEFGIGVSLTSNASSVTLFVNDSPLGTESVSDGSVSFTALLGNRGATPNVLRAEATMADNRTCSLTLPSSIFVDCAGPSCSIESPLANDDGYLNAEADDDGGLAGFQTEIVVSTELAHLGQTVRIELDGAFGDIDDEIVVDESGSGRATFAGLTLAEGSRTVRAECSDAFGVTTFSAPAAWEVDVTPCELTIDSVAGGSDPITPADDASGLPGLQALVEGEIVGDDCKTLLVGLCGGPLVEVPLTQPSGGTFSVPVTLTGTSGTVQVCGAVDDLAGNESEEQQLSVDVRFELPEVAFDSPSNATRYTIAGGGAGVLADGNVATSDCEADVVVNCTEVGQPVTLTVDGTPVTPASCVADGNAPDPFLGRATFTQIPLVSKNDGTLTTLTASQNITGLPTASASISVQADCDAPSCALAGPDGNLATLNSSLDVSGDPGLQIDFVAESPLADAAQTAELIIDQGTPTSLSLAAQGGVSSATFAAVSLSEGPHEVQARCVDAAGNSTSSAVEEWTVDTVACSTTLVVANSVRPVTPNQDNQPDPDLQVSVTGQASGDGCTTVSVGVCSSLGAASPLAGNGSFSLEATLPSATGSVEVCAEVTDEAGNVGRAQDTVAVRVDPPVVEITSPEGGDVFNVSTTCDTTIVVSCSDVGEPVEFFVDGGSVGTASCIADNTASFPLTLPTKNDGSFTSLAAQQSADGLTGAPFSISVLADCALPAPSITAPACGEQLVIPDDDLDLGDTDLQVDVDVANDGIALVNLTVTRGASSVPHAETAALASPTTTFAELNLGGAGTVSLSACVTDTAGNQGCSAACEFTIAEYPNIEITSPDDQDLLTKADDCSPAAGMQVTVEGTSDAATGSTVVVQIGTGTPANTTTDGVGFTACADAPDAGEDVTITASVTDIVTTLLSSTSTTIDVDSVGPTSMAAPSVTVEGRREGMIRLNWTSVTDTDGDAATQYHLRCAPTDIVDEPSWDAATVIPVTTVPATTAGVAESEVFGGFKTGTTHFCAFRAEDDLGHLSALGATGTVANPFLSQSYSIVDDPNTGATLRRVVAEPLGDINGDGIPDFAYGAALRRVQVFFGKDSIGTNALEVPDFEITFGGSVTNSNGFASEVAGLGDINGDSLPDFAVGAPAGSAVFVFFGRASNTWTSIDVDLNSGDGCEADLCVVSSGGRFGWDVQGVNLDGSGPNDLAIAASTGGATAGQVFVLLGGPQLATSGTTLTIQTATPTPNPDGFLITPPPSRVEFGFSIGAAGNSLLIGSVGSGESNPAGLYVMPQTTYGTPGSGLVSLTTPALIELGTGTASQFGVPVRAVGDYDGDSFIDFLSAERFTSGDGGGTAVLYLGSASGFSSASRLPFVNNFTPAIDDNYGTFAAAGSMPGIGELGDLDGDGFADLLIGSTMPDSSAAAFASAQLFYGALNAVGRGRQSADAAFPSVSQTTGQMIPNFVGDVNNDTFNDFVLLDSGSQVNSLRLLY